VAGYQHHSLNTGCTKLTVRGEHRRTTYSSSAMFYEAFFQGAHQERPSSMVFSNLESLLMTPARRADHDWLLYNAAT